MSFWDLGEDFNSIKIGLGNKLCKKIFKYLSFCQKLQENHKIKSKNERKKSSKKFMSKFQGIFAATHSVQK